MTTTQLLKTIKPPKGGAWTSATHAHFEGMKARMNIGGIYLCTTTGAMIQLTATGWKVL